MFKLDLLFILYVKFYKLILVLFLMRWLYFVLKVFGVNSDIFKVYFVCWVLISVVVNFNVLLFEILKMVDWFFFFIF